MKTPKKQFTILAAGAALFCTLATVATANPSEKPMAAENLSKLKQGALLYDNWPELKGMKTEMNHPLYPGEGKKSGEATFRCKECHGWDYIGKDGRYASGSHFTGIRGIMKARQKSLADLEHAITDAPGQHDFSSYLSAADISALTLFIKEGTIAINTVIDGEMQAKGDAKNGALLYAANCLECHGQQGDGYDFKSKKEGIQGVGWAARGNPQETVHKIRWGHPGSDMPSMSADAGLKEAETRDILAYSQTLPY